MNTPAHDFERSHRGNGGTRAGVHVDGGPASYERGYDPSAPPGTFDADRASVGTLLRQLGEDVPELVVKEVALARAEITESMEATRAGIAAMVGGGAVLLTGLVMLSLSAVYGLSAVVAPWLAALIVGGVVLLVGLAMLAAGRKRLAPSALRPDRTMHQLHKNRQAVKGRTA